MDYWLKNSMKNIFSLSEEKTDFNVALKEWAFTGEIIDHEAPIKTCELCEHDSIRYHYEIENTLKNKLWVGSNCIDKFDITIIDEEGNEIKENKEYYLKKQAQKKHIINTFDKLLLTKPTGKLNRSGVEFDKIELDEACKNDFFKGEVFNARMLNYLFMRFDEEGIFYEKRFFSIDLHSQESKSKLLSLDTVQFERIKAALKSSQRKYYINNKEENRRLST